MKCIGLLVFIIAISTAPISAQQLVMPGDYPDPSVVKIGDTYWASATTSNWFPAYPLLKSKDLIKWETAGHVFDELPEWADYYFWAPEISYEKGKVYIYYSAHKKNGNLCVGVASADKPEGPYRDHGPLICQEVGSIDAFPMRDENGKLFMIWKEDGNSVGKPTPIWAQEMNEERTALIGEKKELFRNNETWEANLVEGVSMIRNGDYFYAFYAAAGCCGPGCTYASGIARSKTLLGPWEKYQKNPILNNDDKWKCPGHGTPIEKNGKYYFLYHAYSKVGDVFTGRQGLLIEFVFTPDNWIAFKTEQVTTKVRRVGSVVDHFTGNTLSEKWQWSVFQDIKYSLNDGLLEFKALPASPGAILGQKTIHANYKATASVIMNKTNSTAGLAAIGDEKNLIGVLLKNDTIQVIQIKDGKETSVIKKTISLKGKLYLHMEVENGKDISFFYSNDGKRLNELNETPINGSFLPPWDRAVRAGLLSKGSVEQTATFDSFFIRPL